MSDATIPVDGAATGGRAPMPRFDFPGWWPPMLVKELRQGLRQRGFVGGMIVAQTVLVIMFITGFATDVGNGSSSRGLIDGVFWGTLFAMLIVVSPMRAMAGLSGEIESRTMDLLLLTRLDSWRIVWGKWVSLMAQTLLLVVALLPYAVVRYFFGAVDVVGDLVLIGGMLGASAVLTAAGLWISGMNRVLRLLVVIIGLMTSFSVIGNMLGRGRFGLFSITGASVDTLMFWVGAAACVWWWACLIAYCLMLAVRWFAPPAENHAIGPRLMPLALALPLPILVWGSHGADADELFTVWLVATAVIAGFEMSNARDFMPIHLRGRAGPGGLRGALGAAFLPGWPSAALWLAGVLTAVVALWGLVDLVSVDTLHFSSVPWLAVLAWTGLVFPALLVSLVPTARQVGGALYFLLHGAMGLFGIVAGSNGLTHKAPTFMRLLDWVSHAVPTTSFWHALNETKSPSELPAVELGQAMGVALTLGLMLWLARPYWERVREAREAAARSAARK